MPLSRFRPFPLFLALSCLSMLAFLATSRAGGFLGYPLDDAWIHQTYARNLAWRGEFAFIPGQPSAGSTSPLWTVLLAVGYLLRLNPYVWTYGLGGLALALTAWLTYRLVGQLWPGRPGAALLAGAFAALEWHLVWGAASGMETPLFTALALAAFVVPPTRPGLAGLCVGLSVLARPDGLTVLPFLLLRLWLAGGEPNAGGRRWRALSAAGLGFALACLPYLAFNQALAGSLWPNTYYAKQAEYAVLRQAPLLGRLLQLGLTPLVGAQALLLPGLAWVGWRAVRGRGREAGLALLWALAFIGAYALRLPVTYQHGRYLIPVLPILLALGVGGSAELMRLNDMRWLPRVLSRVWAAALAALTAGFVLVGARAYTLDVQIIETEMVATARWLRANTPPQARIAAHDIGALGYFGERRLLDLAGLVSPEVIPFIRDQARLATWLTEAGADYLVTFPDWYPQLVQAPAARLVFQTGAPFSPRAGGENMTVYQWQAGQP